MANDNRATCDDRLSDESSRQQCHEVAQFAAQTLSISNSRTNELLTELIESINAAQTNEGQWFTSVLKQVEADRQRAGAQLRTALTILAGQIQDELEQTKQDFAKLLSYGVGEGSAAPQSEDPNNS